MKRVSSSVHVEYEKGENNVWVKYFVRMGKNNINMECHKFMLYIANPAENALAHFADHFVASLTLFYWKCTTWAFLDIF